MRKLFCNTGVAGEPINWLLLSQQTVNGMTKSVYEAPSKFFHRTYHMETIESDTRDAQHLSFL